MTHKKNSSLIPVTAVIPEAILDIKYATTDNFTKQCVYSSSDCYLVPEVAYALKKASDEFTALGYTIKIWDCYRPLRAQHIFWQLVPDVRYVADPAQGSRHNRGCAIDLTLVNRNGVELDMGTGFDDFSLRAHRDYSDLPEPVLANRRLLQKIMEKNDFIGWDTEWWHFDFKHWSDYSLLDIPFNEINRSLLKAPF